MYKNGKKIAVCTTVIADHDGGKDCSDNFEYMTLRGRNFNNFIFLKHNITSFCGTKISEKQIKFHRVLKDISALLKDFPIQLACGTALGFHREGGFIEHDDDIDLFLSIGDDDPSIGSIITAVSPAFDVWALRKSELSFIHKKERVRVDLFFLRNGNKHKWYCTYGGPQYDKEIQWKLPMYKPDEITIFGQKYDIMPKWVLPFLYGANWSIPKIYTYNEYLKEPTGIYRLDDTPIPVPKDTFINDFFGDSVYVINLDNRPDKMSRVDEIMKKLGIKYRRFSAKVGVPVCKKLTKGEIGCLWSHVSIWKEALANSAPWTLIFEDDPEFPENITQQHFGEVMLEASVGNRDPQFILFGHCFSRGELLPTIHNKILLKKGSAECTHCYALSLESIRGLLPEVEKKLCKLPIDTIAAKYYEKRNGMYMAYPIQALKGIEAESVYGEGIVLQQRAFNSDVADRTKDKTKGKARD
jgi:GR25 family glycosyltransferase involved in LPS biosynthesis